MSNATMTYDELFAIGDMDSFLTKATKECKQKIGSTRFAGMESEDVVQEALIKVLRSLETYDKTTSRLSTFVDHVLNNMIKDCLRKAGSNKNLFVVNSTELITNADTSDEEGASTLGYLGSVDNEYENFEFITDVMENMNLNDREKLIFQLRMDGYEFVEIAEQLGITKSRLSQLWAKIKSKYEQLDQ